jgi:hypothetical protein
MLLYRAFARRNAATPQSAGQQPNGAPSENIKEPVTAQRESQDQGQSTDENKKGQEKEKDVPSSECKEETRRRRRYRWKLIFGLFLPYFLASVDTTIVATALPTIASHFGEQHISLNGGEANPCRPTQRAELDRHRL